MKNNDWDSEKFLEKLSKLHNKKGSDIGKELGWETEPSLAVKVNESVKKPIEVTFNKKLDPGSVNENSCFLRQESTGMLLKSKVSLKDDGKTVTIQPLPNWMQGGAYNIFFTPDVLDNLGRRQQALSVQVDSV